MKRLLSCLVALVVLLAAMPICAVAEDVPAFSVGSASARAGESVDVPVLIEQNSGIIAMKVMISYDASVLTLTSVTNSNLFPEGDVIFGNNLTANPFNMLWIDSLSRTNLTQSGTFAVLHFTISDTASIGDTTVHIAYESGSTFNTDLSSVVFATHDGTVTVLPDEVGGWAFDEENSFLTTLNAESGINYIVGMDDIFPTVSDFVTTTGGWTYEVIPNALGMESTGSELIIYDENGTEVEHYHSVFYGDVNGDAELSLSDISLIVLATFTTGQLEWEDALFPDEYAESMAADVNHDGMISLDDVSVIFSALGGSNTLNQCWKSDGDPIVL